MNRKSDLAKAIDNLSCKTKEKIAKLKTWDLQNDIGYGEKNNNFLAFEDGDQ